MWARIKPYFIITVVALTSTFILWMPFIFRWNSIFYLKPKLGLSMLDLYRHWDGALYALVARTWYNPSSSILQQSPLGLSADYFMAHFPLYPLLISFLSPFVGYLKSMMIWPVAFAVFTACLFYYFASSFKLTKKPLLLTLVFLFFTPRFFVIRSVPAPETIFMFLVLASIFMFLKKKYFISGFLGALVVLTRPPGILLFLGFAGYYLEKAIREKKLSLQALWLIILPFSLFLLFILYYYQTGDFFAYFRYGANNHLLFPPFQVFNQAATWVKTGWLEDIWFIYAFYLFALVSLWPKPKLRPLFWFMLVYFLAIISVEHKDVSRYSLPMLPGALIAMESFFTSKRFRLVLILLLPALYFYAWNFLLHNVAPITDWSFWQ
jgi:Gpi18-like mannosyltransferase